MIYGITGNTHKDDLWEPAAQLVEWLDREGIEYRLADALADGLVERSLVPREVAVQTRAEDVCSGVDVVLSFGGDGTLLNTARLVGTRETPILGVNIGRLGFLSDIEVEVLQESIRHIEKGSYTIESRMALAVDVQSGNRTDEGWAVNEVVIERSGVSGLILIDVHTDGRLLNTYWADGLIIATPTGSTAYSLAAGGPIMVPGCGAIILTPLAPHSLTVRPIVLPESAVLTVRVRTPGLPHVVSLDGHGSVFERGETEVTIRRASHVVRLLKMTDQDYFQTLRNKLMWGVRKEQ